jgi:exopolysaccharide production protein ExoZ
MKNAPLMGAKPTGLPVQRNEFIQVLRFAAAALVLMTHLTFYYHARIHADVAIWHFGEIGVNIFFVISGVVMVVASRSLSLDASGAQQFMRRRLLRILPLYWLITLIKIAAALALPAAVNNQFDWVFALKSLFFIPTYNIEGRVQPIHGVGWTLLHEMFFYMVFSTMLLLRARPVPMASLLILLLCALGWFFEPKAAALVVATGGVNICFVIGMWIGSVMTHAPIKSRWTLVAVTALLIAATARAIWPSAHVVSPIPMDSVLLILGALMMVLAAWRLPPMMQWLVALGESSYALYLFHPIMAPPTLLVIHQIAAPLGAAVEMGMAALITIVVAHGIHRWVEQPLNRWAKRFF